MTNLKYKSLALATCLIAGLSLAATSYAGEECVIAKGQTIVNCANSSWVDNQAWVKRGCGITFENYAGKPTVGNKPDRTIVRKCKTPKSFVCGNTNPTSTGVWYVDANKHYTCKF